MRLSLNWRHILKESIVKDTDINLPKLQYLEIKNTFDITPEGVQQMADILSRLSRLETLKLKFKSGVDFNAIEEQITKKCRKKQRNKNRNNKHLIDVILNMKSNKTSLFLDNKTKYFSCI